MRITCTSFVCPLQCLSCVSTDSPFQLTNKATGSCLVQTNNKCNDIRWTTGDRLLIQQRSKCLGVQGKSVGSEINLYDCDENSELQKWECKNETVLALKGQELYIELTADNTAVLSKTIGPNNHLAISGTSSGACTRTYRELYAISGNAAGKLCMFPFMYRDQWYSDCTTASSKNHPWCAIETNYESNNLWGYCPTNSKADWHVNPATGAIYQFNTQSAVTWPQAEASCKQQGASLLSINNPYEQDYVTGGSKLWTGLILDLEHGWKWSNGRPYRYMKWDSGHPLPYPGHNCAIVDPTVQYSWQSLPCTKKVGYICYTKGPEENPKQAVETGFCSSPWIPYNGHCFHLNRTQKTWSEAQTECVHEGGDLVSIRNVEEQSFVISQLGYASTDELWIGLNDRKTEGLFDGGDHSTVSFTSWEFGKVAVSTHIKDCVLIRGEKGNWVDRVCDERHGFICMKRSASKPTGDEVEQDVGCKTGWRKHGSYCYFIGKETKTFDEAKDDCKSSDSYLADVSNGVDNAFLVSLVGMRPEKYFWLGLSNQKNIDEFVWTNTDIVRFTHWNAEMPGHRQGCVAMKTGIFSGLWDVLPCANKEKYICKHLAEGAVLTPAPSTLNSPKCADGWSPLFVKLFTESSYKKRTWYEARDYCMTIGGDLLSIHSAAELKMLGSVYTVWIGLSAPDPVTGFVWSDGSPLQFQHWEDDAPNNKNNVESCAEFKVNRWMRSGSWNDVHCETYHGWLCQIQAGKITPPPDPVTPDYNRTSDGWLEWNGNQYYLNIASMAMEDARRFCQQKHAALVTINSEAESVFLWKQISSYHLSYWIGLNVDLDGTFTWMDGSPVEFQRWDENQPDFHNNDENCAIITSSMGFWHDNNCGYEYRSICKRSGSPPANATVAPTVPPRGGCPQNWKRFKSKVRECLIKICYICVTFSVFLLTEMAKTPTTNLWIGLYSRSGQRFHWTDGRPMRYSNWGSDVSGYCNFNIKILSRCSNPSLPDSPEPTVPIEYVKVFNDSIKVVTQPLNWDAAQKRCQSDDANLASLRNEWPQVYVALMTLNLNSPLWIGLNKNQTGGNFRYVDGWHMTLSNWDRNEPSTDRHCVYVDVDGKWKTADCNKKMTSVCMKTTDIPPTESSDFPGFCPDDPETSSYNSRRSTWLTFKGHCYLFVTEKKKWVDASASCIRHGATLASIEDPSEQQFIQNNVNIYKDSESFFWIGLYKTHTGLWKWLDETVMDYTNWDLSLFRDGAHGSIKSSNGGWSTDRHWLTRGYICKAPKGETITVTRTYS
uniref:Mannose receptor, C type 1b n=1 Tax=Seriola dumerili TaxID=41447 RepID=A0A3B4UHI4_SERDU